MASTVAELLVATLKSAGVRRVYGIPGDSANGFTDALRRDGGIAWQHVRHEEAAAFAAAGEAALTGELAVCAASWGREPNSSNGPNRTCATSTSNDRAHAWSADYCR